MLKLAKSIRNLSLLDLGFLIKNIKLRPVAPSMSLEALLITDDLTDSASDGIDGGTGRNCIFFFS